MCRTLEGMHVSDAPSGQELDGARCGSQSSCQKQVFLVAGYYIVFTSLSAGVYGATKALLNLINIY